MTASVGIAALLFLASCSLQVEGAVLPSSATEPGGPHEAAADCRKVATWVAGLDGQLTTVSDWEAMLPAQKYFFLEGIMRGLAVSDILTGAGSIDPSRQMKRVYLVKGWGMRPGDYVTEVGACLRATKRPRKSIAASLVRAEAKFSRTAGQSQRAEGLEAQADRIEQLADYWDKVDPKSCILARAHDGPQHWHTLCGLGVCESMAKGFLEGVVAGRGRILVGISAGLSAFRLNQIQDEMESAVVSRAADSAPPDHSDNYPVLALYLDANAQLLERAAVD